MTGNLRIIRAAVALGLAALGSGQALGAIYNPAADFSISNGNPNGVWSYGYTFSLSPGYVMTLDTATSSGGTLSSWRGNIAGDGNPTVSYNSGAGFVSGTVTLPANSIYMHPGPGGELSILRWTAPEAGSFFVSANFEGIDSTTTDVHVLHDGTDLFTGSIVGFGSLSSSGVLTLDVLAGDTIDIAVGFGGNSYFNDSTAVSLSIASVPEPGAVGMMVGVGAVVLGARQRRI